MRLRRSVRTLLVALALATAGVAGVVAWHGRQTWTPEVLAAIEQTSVIYSPVFRVEEKYLSMRGPKASVRGSLMDVNPPELLWITGYTAVMVGPEDDTPKPLEFMCHANLNLDSGGERPHLRPANPRLFTLSQGQQDVRLPPGFGIPVSSDEALSVDMQVLNLNYDGPPLDVRHKVTIHYVRDADLTMPMTPLFMKAAAGMVSLSDRPQYFNTQAESGGGHDDDHGQGCIPGENAHGKPTVDRHGRRFSGHWVVKPGREENHTLVTRYMNLPFDTTVHYVATHLHPYAESLELRDLTAGTSVFKSYARNFSDRLGLEKVDEYASQEGFELYDDHEYELVSVYNNTSGIDQDSMAVFFLYGVDHAFERPKAFERDDG